MIDRGTRFNIRLGVLTGIMTLGLVLTIVPDVIARSAFGFAINGMAETSVMILVFMVFLGLGAAQANKTHFRAAILDAVLPPGGRRWLATFRYALCAIFCAGFTWYATLGAWDSVLRNEQTYAVIPFPVWPARIAIAVGLALLTLQFIFDLVRSLRGEMLEDSHEIGA